MVNKRTPRQMRRLVAQWRESGEAGARFARRHHVHPWTFWYWCRKVSTEAQTASRATKSATCVPVRVAPEPDTNVVEVVLASGERLHIRGGASADVVRVVVAALRSPC